MITIIHGDDTKASRNFFIEQKQQAATSVTLEGNAFDITTLTEALAGDGLFEENKTVFIEQFLSKRKKSKELDELIRTLNSYSDKEIYLWEGKELDKRLLTSFPKAQIKQYKLPVVIFSFLDSIRPGNGRTLVKLFHQALATTEPEILFSMLIRQFRLLLGISSPTNNPIEEIKRTAPWQQQKLKKQASLFTEEQLLRAYHDLFEFDLAQKTGKLSQSLSSTIDIWLLKL